MEMDHLPFKMVSVHTKACLKKGHRMDSEFLRLRMAQNCQEYGTMESSLLLDLKLIYMNQKTKGLNHLS